MNRINLLPDDLTTASSPGTGVRRHVLCSLPLIVMVSAVLPWGLLRFHSIDRDIAKVSAQIDMRQRDVEREHANAAAKNLLDLRESELNSLRSSVPSAALLALLSQVVPEEIRLDRLNLKVLDGIDSNSMAQPKSRKALGATISTRTGPPQQSNALIELRLIGVAASDSQVTELVTALIQRNVFRAVQLEACQEAESEDQTQPRTFQFSILIRLGERSSHGRVESEVKS